MLSSLFERCMKRRGVKDSDPFDWEKPETISPAVTVSVIANNSPQVISRPITCTSYGIEMNNQLITSAIETEQEPDNKITPEVLNNLVFFY